MIVLQVIGYAALAVGCGYAGFLIALWMVGEL